MLTMRKGFSISFADKLSEGYKMDGKFFTANVSAQKTLPLLESFIKLHEDERLFFILELPTPETAEPKDENGNIIAFHKDIYYLDDCTSAMIRDVLDIVGKILLDDGISQFGVGSHITNDEMMICKYNIVNLYRNFCRFFSIICFLCHAVIILIPRIFPPYTFQARRTRAVYHRLSCRPVRTLCIRPELRERAYPMR